MTARVLVRKGWGLDSSGKCLRINIGTDRINCGVQPVQEQLSEGERKETFALFLSARNAVNLRC